MDISSLGQLFYNLFVIDLFGSEMLFGLGMLVLIGWVSFKLRMSFTGFGVLFVFALLLFSGLGFIPAWVSIVVSLIMLLIVGFGVGKIGRR